MAEGPLQGPCGRYGDSLRDFKRLSDQFSAYHREQVKKEQDNNKNTNEHVEKATPSFSPFLLGAVMRHLFTSHVCGLPHTPLGEANEPTRLPLLLGVDFDSFPTLRQLFFPDNEGKDIQNEDKTAAVASYIDLVAKVIRSTEALPLSNADVSAPQSRATSEAEKSSSSAAARAHLLQQEEELLRCLYLHEVYPCLTLDERKNITYLIPASAHIDDLKEATVFLPDVLLYFVLLHTTNEKRDGLPSAFLECLRSHLQQRVIPSKFLAYCTVWWVLCARLRLTHVHDRKKRAAETTLSPAVLPIARACLQLRADHIMKSFFRLRANQSLTEEKIQLARLLEKRPEPAATEAAKDIVALSGTLLEEIFSELVACAKTHCLSSEAAGTSAVHPSATEQMRLAPALEQEAATFASALRACQPPAPPVAPKSKGFLLCRMISPSLENAHSSHSVLRHCFNAENASAVANVILPIPNASPTATPASAFLSTSANPFRFRRHAEFFVRSVQAAQTWCGVTDTIYFALLALTNAPHIPASQLARLFIALEDTIVLISRGQCLATHARDVDTTQPQQHQASRLSEGGGEVSELLQPSLPLDMLLNADDAKDVYTPYVLETLDLLCYFIEVENSKHVGLVEEAKQCVLHHVEGKLQSAMP